MVQARAPTLIVFDTPNGKVDATFFGPNNHSTFTAEHDAQRRSGSADHERRSQPDDSPALTGAMC